MRNRIALLVCAATMAAVPATALARASADRSAPRAQAAALSALDTSFIQAAVQGNIAEIEAAQLAQAKSHNPAVLLIAKWIERDHSKMLKRADWIATQLGVTLPTAPSAAQTTMIDGLQNLSGHAFNLAFAQDEVTGHEQFIAQIQQELSSGTNTSAKGLAKWWLPFMQHHMQLAQAAVVALGGPAN
jgi:putative membrane protein